MFRKALYTPGMKEDKNLIVMFSVSVKQKPAVKINLRSLFYNESNNINTFAASYLNTEGLNNSCLKSPASTLVDLTFQSRALRPFSLNQLRNLSL